MRISITHIAIGSALLLSVLWFSGCKKDKLYLNDTDLTTELDLGVAVPVGSMRMTMGDVLGSDQVDGLYFDSLDNRGVLTYKGEYNRILTFHDIDLSQYISHTNLSMNVYDKLKEQSWMTGHNIVGTGQPITITFPMTMQLDGINKDEYNERLDSALIRNAKFNSVITANDLPIKWEWIDKVSIDLGDAFTRAAGNNVVVYDKNNNPNGYTYGSTIPIEIDEFSLCLMKNRNPQTNAQYLQNVIDSCTFLINFQVTIPTSAGVIYVPDDAAFDYMLSVQFIDYHAIWGMFSASKDMHDEDRISLADSWGPWQYIKQAVLPLSEPVAEINVTTQVAGALWLYGDYLYAEDAQGNHVDVELGKQFKPYYFKAVEYLGLDSQIGDSATMSVLFDNTATNGHLDHLFSVRPDYIGYKYHIDFNATETPQIRITPNTGLHFALDYTLPFIFNEGLALQYSDTITGIDLSKATLDSLLAEVEVIDTVKTSNLKLFVKLENTIQLGVKGTFIALDGDNQPVIDPTTGAPFQLTSSDTLTILPPTMSFQHGNWLIDKPYEAADVISVNEERLEAVSKIKKIVFDATVDNQSLDYAFEQGAFHNKITEDAYLKVNIGITADIDAIFEFGTLDEVTGNTSKSDTIK